VATYLPVELSTDAFESFDAPGQVTIGVDLQTLADRLGYANSNDLVSVAVDMETRKLELHYRNIEQSVALIDSEAIRQEPDHPDLDLPNTVTITGEDFDTAVKVCDEVGDHLTIQGRPDDACTRFTADGDVDDTVVTFGADETADPTQVVEATDTMLSLEYMTEFAQPMPDDAEVTIQFGDEFPIVFDYEACDGNLTVHGMCAPRISTN
jgi:proliferating cell nuclear antigen